MKNKENERMIGFYGTREMDTMITLVSIKERVNRSELLRDVLAAWLKRSKFTEEKLIPIIVERAHADWVSKYKLSDDETGSLKTFIKDFGRDMRSRQIREEIVEKIIDEFNEYWDRIRRKNQHPDEA